jgi:hypothetical protein
MESLNDQARTCYVCGKTRDVPDLIYVDPEDGRGYSGWYCPECLPKNDII